MTEVLYPSAFSQDYAYFGMPKRKPTALELSPDVEDPEAWGILDERLLLKGDEYLSAPRTSQSYSVGLPLQYQDNQMQYQYSGIDTTTIPAGFSDHSNSVYMTTPEPTVQAYSPEDFGIEASGLGISSVPMQHQLSHESMQYYHTPMSTAVNDASLPTVTTQNLSDPFSLGAGLSSYSHLQSSDSKSFALALCKSNSMNRIKPKRQFTTAKEALFTCQEPNCGKHFKRIWNFKAHQETHNPQRPKPFKCSEPSCSKTFVRRTDRERHETCVHSKKKEFKCNLCNSMFARKDTLRRHEDDGCSKRPGFPKSKPKKRRSPKIPNREPNPSLRVSSKSSSRKSSSASRPAMESHLLSNRSVYKTE